ncbi:MAG: hypothetical protein JO354_11220 [Verrucomicrobia bacterium]|nr:hypothetical protein [Verrucomicrobiota bacterium]
MKLPFAQLFQRAKTKAGSKEPKPAPAPMPVVRKAQSERLAKTVLPSAAKPETTQAADFRSEKGGNSETCPTFATELAQVSNLRSEEAGKSKTISTGAAKISMGGVATNPAQNLPPAVAIALEPNVERAISLPLADVIAQMPDGYLRPREALDVNRRVLLKAAEVEKGMATGRPAIAVTTLFQQVPEIFMHTVPSSDGAMVALPFDRVLNELSNLSLRSDQATEQAVPQVETPFLQAALEDTERFGTPLPAMREGAEKEELPPVRVEPASAEAFAAAVPEATEFVARPKAQASDAGTSVPVGPSEYGAWNSSEAAGLAEKRQTQDLPESTGAMRIPFTPPIPPSAGEQEKFGTGEPAFPRVPASSGPPVPSAPPTVDAPTPIPFSFPAPSDDVWKYAAEQAGAGGSTTGHEEMAEPLSILAESTKAEVPSYHEPILQLPLRPILERLPPMQLGGNPAAVPEHATVSFPESAIAPQLATGKVTVSPTALYAVLSEEYRRFFVPHAVDAPVELPLRDVLANLPGDALKVRSDQEAQAVGEMFETPFSATAAEDAARLSGKEAEAPKTQTPKQQSAAEDRGARAAVAQVNTPQAETAAQPQQTRQPEPSPCKTQAKDALEQACALPGIDACSVIFRDGLSIAGNIPEEMHMEGLSAVAPTLLQKIEKHMLETSLGRPLSLTVHGDKAPVTFCAAGDICVTAVHRGELGAIARRELTRLTEELSRAYSETPHVDH